MASKLQNKLSGLNELIEKAESISKELDPYNEYAPISGKTSSTIVNGVVFIHKVNEATKYTEWSKEVRDFTRSHEILLSDNFFVGESLASYSPNNTTISHGEGNHNKKIRELLRIPMTKSIKSIKTKYNYLKLKCLNTVKQITNTKILLLPSFL